jgi:prolyl-tRNA editing enzyme YbaK/EbsC (Cys-tRNA(Pro) deacylase)
MENVLNKESVKRVDKDLKTFDLKLNIEVVKSLLLKADDGFVLCLVSGDKKCSLNKVKKITGKKDVCMANADDVKKQTGFTIGGVSPVGLINKLEILIDDKLNRFQDIFAAAGHPNAVFKVDLNSLNKITKGKIMDISE